MSNRIKSFQALLLTGAMLFSLTSCLRGGDGDETLPATDSVQTEAVTTEAAEKTAEEIYREAEEKLDSAEASDMEMTMYASFESEETGKMSYNAEMREKYVNTADGELYSKTTTTTDENGASAQIYTYGAGVGYYSESSVGVYSECEFDDYMDFVYSSSGEDEDPDIADFGKLEKTEKDGGYVISYSQPNEDVLEYVYGIFEDGWTIDGSDDEVMEGEFVIDADGYISGGSYHFSSKMQANGVSFEIEFGCSIKLLSVNEPDKVTVTLPSTTAYTEIDSLEAFSLVQDTVGIRFASANSEHKYDYNYGGYSGTVTETDEYLSSEENGVYTATLESKGSGNEVDRTVHAEYDGTYLHMAVDGQTASQEMDQASAYSMFIATVAPFALDAVRLTKAELEESDGVSKITVGFNDEYAVEYAYYFLSNLYYGDPNADFSFLYDAKTNINDCSGIASFDADRNLTEYTVCIDTEFTDSTGTTTAFRAEITVSDIILY